MITNNKTICICIPIEVDDYLKNFIFKNINYRRKVWNDFVEEANKFKGKNCMYDGFKSLKFKTEYFQNEEANQVYETMCVGISEQVSKEAHTAINCIRDKNHNIDVRNETNQNNAKISRLKFHSFDRYYGSFKVHNKVYLSSTNNKIYSRLRVLNDRTLSFRVRGGPGSRYKTGAEILTIRLKESLYKCKESSDKYPFFIRKYKVKGENAVECWFSELGIKETTFIHKLGKFYIQLSIECSYFIQKRDIKSRKIRAGIDTGIHNPAILYLGKGVYSKIELPLKKVNKLHYLERRAKRYQHIMDNKYRINIERVKRGELDSPYTKNYEKVRSKFRKVWYKINAIKLNWIYTTCKIIVTNFQIICVDKFTQPSNRHMKNIKLRRKFNFVNRFHCMFKFNTILKHMADKYGCVYIEAPRGTTCTCSFCGTTYDANTDDLAIREFACMNKDCANFGNLFDRDKNAARNCYKYLKKYL